MYTDPPHDEARKGVPTVLQIVHGYPPRELAGTEIATARLVRGLHARGWRCHVLAATRAPGHRQYSLLENVEGITRVVDNLPHRPLGQERDRAHEALVEQVIRQVRPDIVHVQHLAHLSSRLRFDLPAVGTLHDHWPWCPKGGTMLRPGGVPCPAPEPSQCVRCYTQHARLPGRVEHAAVVAATRLAPLLSPSVLHGLYQRLPLVLRARLRGPPSRPGHEDGVDSRRRAYTDTWNALDARIAPSAFLAREAERHGLDPVLVVPSGLDQGPPHRGGGPLVHLGSVLPHKGVHLVVQAYRQAFGEPGAGPGLAIHGAIGGAPAYARSLDWSLAGTCPADAVPGLLQDATALVMGSTWPENAPLVILEARAAGCPVVAPRIGGIPELVEHGRDGLLYPPGDVEALGRCLVQIASAAPGAWAVQPPPSLDDHVAQVEAIYHRILGASPTPATRRSGP